MSKNQLSTTYKGVQITFDERYERWCFCIDGCERSSETMANTKKTIDNPPKKRTAKPFKKFQAWHSDGYGDLIEVTVTSYEPAKNAWSNDHVWIRTARERRKVSVGSVFPRNPKNDELALELANLSKAADALAKRTNAARIKLQPYRIPATEEERNPQ